MQFVGQKVQKKGGNDKKLGPKNNSGGKQQKKTQLRSPSPGWGVRCRSQATLLFAQHMTASHVGCPIIRSSSL